MCYTIYIVKLKGIDMITISDVKVHRHTKDHTFIQKWESYWFEVNGKVSFSIEKQDGVFRFFSKHCTSLEDAKQHIANMLNAGKNLNQI